jgi:hypothetical protein
MRPFAARMWPTVRDCDRVTVLDLQAPRGEIAWERKADGSPGVVRSAGRLLQHLPEPALRGSCWRRVHGAAPARPGNLRPDQLGHVIVNHPEAFADKSRSLDGSGNYPGPRWCRCAARAAAADWTTGWSDFVVLASSRECVSDQALGHRRRVPVSWCSRWTRLATAGRAVGAVSATSCTLRDADGAYWSGWQFVNQAPTSPPSGAAGSGGGDDPCRRCAGRGARTGGAGLLPGADAVCAAPPPADASACGWRAARATELDARRHGKSPGSGMPPPHRRLGSGTPPPRARDPGGRARPRLPVIIPTGFRQGSAQCHDHERARCASRKRNAQRCLPDGHLG